ncbi:MAG: hypothetical protein NTV23_04160 [Propionibacteriales bacterium]|nr:hypothetical protein [Propionibacteriales bacterium]
MQTRRLAPSAAVLIAVVALATGCGGDDGPKSAPTASASVTGPGTDPVENIATGDRFVEALAANTERSLAAAAALAAPGSVAQRYVVAAQQALVPGSEAFRLTRVSEGRFRLCDADGCTVLTALALSDGKVSSFRVISPVVRNTP